MRTPILTSSLLLGSCLACGAALAQQADSSAATQPTASTTILVTQEETPDAGMPPADVQPQPTASTTIVAAPAPTASTTIVTAPAPTASTTIVTSPASAPLPPGFQPAASATVVLPSAVAPATASIAPVATTQPVAPGTDPVIDAATYQKRTEFDNTPYRFNMEQNGKRMTADEFSAWMAARGVRVARGPLPHRPENPTMDNRPGQGSTRPVGVRQEMVLAPMPGAAAVPPVVTPGTLQPDSVAPTDEWTEAGVPAAPTASTTLVVPVDPATVEGEGQ